MQYPNLKVTECLKRLFEVHVGSPVQQHVALTHSAHEAASSSCSQPQSLAQSMLPNTEGISSLSPVLFVVNLLPRHLLPRHGQTRTTLQKCAPNRSLEVLLKHLADSRQAL